MSIRVRPITANLTHDTELFSRMVNFLSSRTHMLKSILEASSLELESAKMEVNILLGTKHLHLTQLLIPTCEFKFGTLIQ